MSEDCPHCVFEKTEANCRGCFEGSHYKPKPITNADRIRAMTDEELAEYLDGVCHDLWQMFVKDPKKMWLNWLRQEATDD